MPSLDFALAVFVCFYVRRLEPNMNSQILVYNLCALLHVLLGSSNIFLVAYQNKYSINNGGSEHNQPSSFSN